MMNTFKNLKCCDAVQGAQHAETETVQIGTARLRVQCNVAMRVADKFVEVF